MKKLALCSTMLASVLAFASPSLAQGGRWDRDAFWRGAPSSAWDRIDFLQQRIDRGRSDGSLSRGEAMRAQNELRRIRYMARDIRRHDGGRFTSNDEMRVQQRLDDLSRRIRWLRHNGW